MASTSCTTRPMVSNLSNRTRAQVLERNGYARCAGQVLATLTTTVALATRAEVMNRCSACNQKNVVQGRPRYTWPPPTGVDQRAPRLVKVQVHRGRVTARATLARQRMREVIEASKRSRIRTHTSRLTCAFCSTLHSAEWSLLSACGTRDISNGSGSAEFMPTPRAPRVQLGNGTAALCGSSPQGRLAAW